MYDMLCAIYVCRYICSGMIVTSQVASEILSALLVHTSQATILWYASFILAPLQKLLPSTPQE